MGILLGLLAGVTTHGSVSLCWVCKGETYDHPSVASHALLRFGSARSAYFVNH